MLDHNYEVMQKLAITLNSANENPELRIIVATHGPVCFAATILSQLCSSVHKSNIVAVTADIGLEVLNELAETLDLPIHELGGPPVWGFAGINHYVDIDHVVQKATILKPYKRGKEVTPGSTLAPGEYVTDIRYIGYLTKDLVNFWTNFKAKKVFIFFFL